MVYSSGWTKPAKDYSRPMEVNSLFNAHVFISSQLLPPIKNKAFKGKYLKDLWPMICILTIYVDECIRLKGTIVFPCSPIEDLFDLIDEIYNLIDSDSIKHVPIHTVSSSGKYSLALSNVYSEWY
jgi:hypothetical protein